MPQDLEKVYVLLFQCVGNGSQPAQRELAERAVLGVGKRCDSCSEDTSPLVHQQPIAGMFPESIWSRIRDVEGATFLAVLSRSEGERPRCCVVSLLFFSYTITRPPSAVSAQQEKIKVASMRGELTGTKWYWTLAARESRQPLVVVRGAQEEQRRGRCAL